ncbi:MAG TPA: glycosyltransferase [Verrucomicrobiae bacterium]|nr:glycosyltransferase [Verrucomicrobiae bacterium]
MSYTPVGSELIVTNTSFTGGQGSPFSKPISKRPRRSTPPVFPRQNASPSPNFPIIVHCHLCWDWVWQRPQQFLSRLSARHKILFIETIGPDAQLSSPMARFWTATNFPNVTILRLQFPVWRWSDGAFVDRERRRLVKEFLSGPGAGQFENAVQWFYDPMAVPSFLGQMDEIGTVYDCMDELSKFRGAPPQIRMRERRLLGAADVVFAGGHKLWEAKKLLNENCHFYGCGVDVTHFGKAREIGTQIPDDIASLQKPVLGYFGVIDERMDYDLLVKLADANPNWSIAMVGPTLKVDRVPQRSNLHWLGQKNYLELPAYCKAFDVCMMPFALNEATQFINPTKALEYMSTGKPIVSSAVPDVVTNFGSVVKIARSHEEFIALCRQAIESPDASAIEAGLTQAANNSWDSIVTQLEEHMAKAIGQKQSIETIA